jgi:hypothetical protein
LFGGLNSVEYDGENWVGSENSNYAVVNVMNNVFTHPDADVEYQLDEGALQNQNNFPQPLKEAMIGYIANVSAVKRG